MGDEEDHYVPTTEAVRCYWSIGCDSHLWWERRVRTEERYGPEFDRWLKAQRIEAVRLAQKAIANEDTVEWARKAEGSVVTLPYAIESLDDLIEDIEEGEI